MLIFSNGKAYLDNRRSGYDIDDEGLPVSGADFSVTANCFIEAQTENKSGKNEDGVYPVGSYTIYLDYDSVPTDFLPSKVRLEHERKGNLGIFTIQRIEFYDLTRTIQIWV